ncbi:acetyl-coenzyme A synthetase [Deinococcus irradiatisoli]|uniref:acetate--CoA ligase n=1 Tax=Deinococcus irradiatisoli TaxID=2202254 RepID=A0A2Z3JKY0_9DEIO|nr:acetate--CoA ligase [Deinococcus irradiatisoli]AWN23569.1 acetyl-coenzyme A synthetase [Deinococcus irradiatisoli]
MDTADAALLGQALVSPTDALRREAPVSPQEAERLRSLPPTEYWAAIAGELDWDTRWTQVLDGSLGDFRYFVGARGNVSVNCLDRHAEAAPDKVALHYEREDGLSETWTYRRLTIETARFAAALQDMGVGKGDRVALLLSNIPEAFIAIHACYRIGAIYSVIFAGFSASAVRDRLEDAQPKVVVVADGLLRRGKVVPLKDTLDEARRGIDSIKHVVVATRLGLEVQWQPDERRFDDVMTRTRRLAEPVMLDANDPGFIIYTSGTTSKPKGLVHSGLGFLVGTYANVKWSLNLRRDDVYWCTADVGWLTFPIFALVGGLAHGATHVIYEGSIDTPTPSRPYELIEKYSVNKVFTAPTALRMLRRAGQDALAGHDLSKVELIALVGEPLDPETWHWTSETFGAFVNNTYGQTETGTAWASSMVGLTSTKPGSCGEPLPGYRAEVVDEEGRPVPAGQLGYLTLTEPFPCLARTVWNDPQRYFETYFGEFPGRYASADAAMFDEDGQLWVTGRVDDVMNVSGHRIGTMELEAALITHPAVSEAAVVAQPDDLRGAVPVAFVVPRAGAGGGADLGSELAEAIVTGVGKYARPAAVYVVPTLPRTRSGKIMRRLLRDLLQHGEVRGDLSSLENPDALDVVQQHIRAG